MKKVFILALTVAANAFTACHKEDSSVDMSQLVGEWNLTGIVGAGISYTFYNDGEYMCSTVSIINPNTPNGIHHSEYGGKYEVSTDGGKIIRLFRDGSDSVQEYFLLELNSQKMKWKEIVYGGQSTEATFSRVID